VWRDVECLLLAVSRFWHVAKVVSPTKWVCEEYKRIVWPFIRKSNTETISRQRCSKGGLNVVDFATKSFLWFYFESPIQFLAPLWWLNPVGLSILRWFLLTIHNG